jgi:hypothetical protein
MHTCPDVGHLGNPDSTMASPVVVCHLPSQPVSACLQLPNSDRAPLMRPQADPQDAYCCAAQVFVNASTSDVVATTSVEALAMVRTSCKPYI